MKNSKSDSLIRVMQELYDSEINCGIESEWDGGFNVYIGNHGYDGIKESALFDASQLTEAAIWLSEAATRCYPNSSYAQAAQAAIKILTRGRK